MGEKLEEERGKQDKAVEKKKNKQKLLWKEKTQVKGIGGKNSSAGERERPGHTSGNIRPSENCHRLSSETSSPDAAEHPFPVYPGVFEKDTESFRV